MKTTIKNILSTLILLIIPCVGLATITQDRCFDISSANKTFDNINITLSTQNLNKDSIQKAIDKLSDLQEKSSECSAKITENLTLLTKGNSIDIGKEKKEAIVNEISEYNDFTLRTEKAISALKETIRKSNVNKLFKSRPPIWSTIAGKTNENSNKVANTSNIKLLDKKTFAIFLGVLSMGLMLGAYLTYVFIKILKSSSDPYARHLIKSWRCYSLPLSVSCLISLFFAYLYWNNLIYEQLSNLSYATSIYILITLMLSLLFPHIKSEDEKESELYKARWRIHINLNILTAFIYTGIVSTIFIDMINIQPSSINIIETGYLILLALFIFHTFLVAIRIFKIKSAPVWIQVSLRTLLYIALFSILALTLTGYHNLTIFIIKSSLLTFLSYYLFRFYFFCSEYIFSHIQESKNESSRKIKKYFDTPPHKKIMGVTVIQFGLTILATLLFFTSLLSIWGVSTQHINNLKDSIIDGFNYYGLNIEPLRIIFAIFMFGATSIIFKLFSGKLAQNYRSQHENIETQVTMSSVINYIGISIAVLIAMLVAGFNFTGLAIIAGALSVGVGLGLQTIVNNFICGLILMIEKPIKPGDRIIVNGVEGIVKKIRPRSTQVSLLSKEDVIFPNSELISSPVTNYMFRDPLWRVTCKVGVAYGSNTDLIKEVLLNVAAENSEVLDESPYQPIVLFRDFGNSSLEFELWCTINNVNRKYYIMSDLNYEIDKAFRKNNITIAFPQRDIHIKKDAVDITQ